MQQSGNGNEKSAAAATGLTRKDFVSDQEVRWCPGCGDYSILAAVQRVMPDLGIPREKLVFVSGIGCSSRFPYYMNTYGFHGIHGRAPGIASGIKITNPDLSVWVVTGDGDGLSIGGNHLIHAIRRNLDINIILFNNRIYGLTKGQYSPTSEFGKRTKSSPQGVLDYPIHPVRIAIAAEATWVGRSIDIHAQHLAEMIRRMARHKGVSFLEVYQNCNIFNDKAFVEFAAREVRDDRTVHLEHGQPLLFGKGRNMGIRVRSGRPEVVEVGKDADADEVLVHDATDAGLAYTIAQMEHPEYPMPIGVFLDIERPSYEAMLVDQIDASTRAQGKPDVAELLRSGDLWTVE
jgi:2-oxoglutarate ferredoxin oxidoreductase subunit beta